MDRGAYQATVMGSQGAGYKLVTNTSTTNNYVPKLSALPGSHTQAYYFFHRKWLVSEINRGAPAFF